MKSKRTMLVTTALPYANGPLHLGHMVEHIQADIWVRFQKMCGHNCLFISGDDAHGTPIMLSAEQNHQSPDDFVHGIFEDHKKDFHDFFIDFDNYHTTHSPENASLVQFMYQRLCDQKDIEVRQIMQAYDPEKKLFLPDRFVKGDCPRCHAKDQYGDSCESCGATYTPLALNNPRSVLSGATPLQKSTEHHFFCLNHHTEALRTWINQGHLQEEVRNKLMEWFELGLEQWDISRDAPYFGFLIPGTKDKYFYVWLDAPIGYMASFQNLCHQKDQLSFQDYWHAHSDTELYHFIGKDIIYFHALFWPALLMSAHLRTPTAIYAHGFLTVHGKKMSKSRGTFVTARAYLDVLNPEYFRYYLATKLSNRLDDLNINPEDFVHRVNTDLVGKIINIASRSARFIERYFGGVLAHTLDDQQLIDTVSQSKHTIAQHYEDREFSKAMRCVVHLADQINQYIDQKKPWALAKTDPTDPRIQNTCSVALHAFMYLMVYLKPVLPETTQKVELFLDTPPLDWDSDSNLLLGHSILPFQPLMERMRLDQIHQLIHAT